MQIGPISLQDFEIPQAVRFGGRYRLAVHRLAGGGRIVERLGPDDGDISFQGVFSGPNAEARARQLDTLRAAGTAIWLTWESFRRLVIVSLFEGDYRSPWWIPYRCGCTVVTPADTTTLTTLSQQILADVVTAQSASSGLSIDLATVQAALSTPDAVVPGTAANFSATAATAQVIELLNNQIVSDSSTVSNSTGTTTSTPEAACAAFEATLAGAGSLAGAVVTRSYVGRAQSALSTAGG